MARKEKPQPYIGYKTAIALDRMHDFIIHANNQHKALYEELGSMIRILQSIQQQFSPMKDPNNQWEYFERDHFTNPVATLRADAWEAGLTKTLFEKLKDKAFQIRFTGFYGLRESPNPVLKEEIEDPPLPD